MTAPHTTDTPYPSRDTHRHLDVAPNQVRILNAAADAFAERGYDATSIDDIADRLGATKGAVYYSYRSKVDVFLAVCERGTNFFEQQTAKALDDHKDATAAAKLTAVSRAHVEHIMDQYAYNAAIRQGVEHRRQMPLKDADRRRFDRLDNRLKLHESLVHALVVEGQEDGSLRSVPTCLATRTLIGGINGVALWYSPVPAQEPKARSEIADSVVEMLMAGLVQAGHRP